MRITNQMMTNNSLFNINKNKLLMNTLGEQYASGKRIQRPSDDPIIAVRALKLRTNVSQLTQYAKKNIPDAKSWMEVTESALDNVDTILENIRTQINQGTSDPLSITDRESIIASLTQMKSQVYQEGNSNYAGRYVFTGYKTDTSLAYTESDSGTRYQISETFSGQDIELLEKVKGAYDIADYDPANPNLNNFQNSPTGVSTHRIRLAYGNLDDKQPVISGLTYKDAGGNTQNAAITKVSSTDPDAYTVGANEVKFIVETGELIIGDKVYEDSRLKTDGAISVTYDKTNFQKDDLRPQHYFDCTTYDAADTAGANPLNNYKQTADGQNIEYEITFNQKLQVNTEGKNTITHGIGRDIDELLSTAKEVAEVESKIAEVDKLLANPANSLAQIEVLKQMKSHMETEKTLKNKILHDTFASGLTSVKEYQDKINIAVADSGSRYNRLKLTEDRMTVQLDDATDLMSQNEDADMVEVLVKSTSAETAYNASLSVAAKIVKNTLLDFI